MPALDFVRAKVQLAFSDSLREKLLTPRLQVNTYGRDSTRGDVRVGARLRIGRYGFVVRECGAGGRRDVRLVLHYDRVPSLLGLKTIVPDRLQQVLRFRRSRQRAVT